MVRVDGFQSHLILLEFETKNKIKELTNRISWLTEDFQKVSYPPIKSAEEENKRIEELKKQLGWGATGMEVPPLPESKRGLKFHSAAPVSYTHLTLPTTPYV